jgi:hypothetical protein
MPGLTTQWSGRSTAQAFSQSQVLVPVGRRSPGTLGHTSNTANDGRDPSLLVAFRLTIFHCRFLATPNALIFLPTFEQWGHPAATHDR